MTRRVFFYVQHLLGIGHVFRALRIARGLRDAGFEVDLVMGGVPVADLDTTGLNVIQLQPLKAGPDGFSALVTPTGEPAGLEMKASRTAALIAAFSQRRPDVLLVEAFPFGRRQMRFELMPLLQVARERKPRPVIVASVRDILQESGRPERVRETVDVLRSYFDRVVVHGDPRIVTLGETFPLAGEIEDMILYSGIAAPRPVVDRQSVIADVVVSAGGGAVGRRLLETAIAAKRVTALASDRWLVLAGPNAEVATFVRLAAEGAKDRVSVERFVPDLAAILASAKLSISQAGYNTVADILVARCRAVFIPFAQGGETEQTRRAHLLQERGFGVALAEDKLTAETLAAAVDQAMALPPPAAALELDGADRTASILANLLTAPDSVSRKHVLPDNRHG